MAFHGIAADAVKVLCHRDDNGWKRRLTVSHSFQIRDAKDRPIGALAHSFKVSFAASGGTSIGGWKTVPGEYFAAVVHATRHGDIFGASQPTHYFTTQEECDKWIGQRVSEMRKSYEKKFG